MRSYGGLSLDKENMKIVKSLNTEGQNMCASTVDGEDGEAMIAQRPFPYALLMHGLYDATVPPSSSIGACRASVTICKVCV